VARNIGEYSGEPVVEVEEIVVETPTFSFEDYLNARLFHLLLTIFYYEGNYEEAFAFARQEGVGPSDLIVHLQAMLDQAPDRFRVLIEDFIQESQDELFYTKEECTDWAHRNFQSLVEGSVGGNLLSKYSMEGRFCATQDSLRFLESGMADFMGNSRRACALEQIQAVFGYLRTVLLHAPFSESIAADVDWVTSYDVETWRTDGYCEKLDAYRYPEPQVFHATVDPRRREIIKSRIRTFGEHPAGLGKFTRTMFAKDLRRTLTANRLKT
jgi:hypothetical protein